MHQLSIFIASNTAIKKAQIWSNGADFDVPILAHIYMKMGMSPPWQFYNVRCYRTVKNMAKWVENEQREIAHNALSDADDQTRHLFRVATELEKMGVKLHA